MDSKKSIVKKIAISVKNNGGRTYYVGGYVRDKLMNTVDSSVDIDIEVHKISEQKLEAILDDIAQSVKVGKSFGIYKLPEYNVDVALPRTEISTGLSHRDFQIVVDENIGTYVASKRRDFTINSVMEDVLTGELIDHFGGVRDIHNGVIRHVDDSTFMEDPLRVLRAARFASRFHFDIHKETIELCKQIDITKLSKERVFEELIKVLLTSNKPSIFFDALYDMNHLHYWFYEIEQLKGVVQNKIYHAEGDVYTHTMMVLDEGVKYLDKVKQPMNYMFALLCHDLGKIVTTEEIDGRIRSLKHEIEGMKLSKRLLSRFTNNKRLIKYVSNMVREHMMPNMYSLDNSKIKVTNRMFYQSVEPNDLIYVALADNEGRISEQPVQSPEEFLLERLRMFREIMSRPHVTGKDLIDNGVKEGEDFSKILAYATTLRLAGVDKDSSLKQTLGYARKLREDK